MQSTKSSKKTRKTADATVAATPEVSVAAEVPAKPRAARSSKTKKADPAETGTVKHHHKTNSPVVAEPAVVEVEPVVKAAAAVVSAQPAKSPAHEEIAKLSYSYFAARGYVHGFAEEDWLRAERELTRR
ncbi:MAG: DUF2934 domain-containing protein [Acidobacteriaceae bacterium]|nr:DUF2934 domain-containing protein [Acidobacteriaceae bacterium]